MGRHDRNPFDESKDWFLKDTLCCQRRRKRLNRLAGNGSAVGPSIDVLNSSIDTRLLAT